MNHIRDKKRWAANFCTPHVKCSDNSPLAGILFGIGAVTAVMLVGMLMLTVAAHFPHLASLGALGFAVVVTPEDKLDAEIKSMKTSILEAIGAKADLATVTAMQKQLDALDVAIAHRHVALAPDEPIRKAFEENESVQRILKDRKGTAVVTLNGKQMQQLMERKTTITSGAVGSSTSGVLTIDRIPGITPEARQKLMLRNMLTSRPTTMQIIDFVKVLAKPAIGSPQTEASDKGENAATFTTKSERIQTIATWIPASRQVLDDMDELMMYIQTGLPYYVNLEEEKQMLTGSGSGTDLDGLITQATAFDTALLVPSAGWNRLDLIGHGIQQISEASEFEPSFIVLNPKDYWNIRLTKDNYGRYILGDPQDSVAVLATGGVVQTQQNWFGLTPVSTNNIAPGSFLIGSGDPNVAEIRDRMEMQVEIATQHSDYFTKNLIAIRAEKRLALICRRPAAFITGSFSTSPVVAGQ
jgi:HK97 family phage major capsid protein